MLGFFARPRRGAANQLVTRGLIELARLHNHYKRSDDSRRYAKAAISEALTLADSALARSAMAVFLDATEGNQPARRRLMARLIRSERTPAQIAAIWTLAIPGLEIPGGASRSYLNVLGGDGEARRDIELAVSGLQTIAAGHVADGDREAAANALFHSQLILETYGAKQHRLWTKQVELADVSSDPYTLHQALVAFACDLLGISDDLWDTPIFEVTGRRDNLPVVESNDGVPQKFVIHWPTGSRALELRQLLERASSIDVTIQSAALLAALSIRTNDQDTCQRCLTEMTHAGLTSDGEALVLAAFAIWAARERNTETSTRIVARLVPYLASHGNQMAAFALQSNLVKAGAAHPRRRWRLDVSEKAAALNAVRGLTLERLAEFAEAEIIRVKKRQEAKRLLDLRG
jgi:hypothetical protein